MGVRLYSNFVSTKLTAQLLAAGTSCTVTTGDGALFSGANGTDWYIGVLRRMSGFKDVAHEIVKVSNRSTDTLTIVRAQESTTALQFEVGDQVDVDFTAASLTALETAAAAYTPTITSGTGAFTTVSGAGSTFKQVGKFVDVNIQIAITTLGTAASYIIATLPVTARAGNFQVTGFEVTTGTFLTGRALSVSSVLLWKYDGTFFGANGHVVEAQFRYEAA